MKIMQIKHVTFRGIESMRSGTPFFRTLLVKTSTLVVKTLFPQTKLQLRKGSYLLCIELPLQARIANSLSTRIAPEFSLIVQRFCKRLASCIIAFASVYQVVSISGSNHDSWSIGKHWDGIGMAAHGAALSPSAALLQIRLSQRQLPRMPRGALPRMPRGGMPAQCRL